jgi:membrane protease YdiL (CAAX protease family)
METMPSSRTDLPGYPWKIFWLLLAASVLGVAAVLPFVFALFRKMISVGPLPMPVPVLVAVQLTESAIFFAGLIALGLLLARKVGIETPVLRRWFYSPEITLPSGAVRVPILSGIVVAALSLLLFYTVFLPRIPEWPVAAEAMLPIWKRFAACFYGAIDEEILARLFALPLFLWLFRMMAREKSLQASPLIFWIANVIASLLFAAGHIPAAKIIMPMTPMVLTAILSLNGAPSLLFGYLCWKRGFEAAILAHFSADVTLHVIGPMFMRT